MSLTYRQDGWALHQTRSLMAFINLHYLVKMTRNTLEISLKSSYVIFQVALIL